MSAGQLAAIRTRLAELLAAEGDQAGIEVHQEAGADRLADLVNKGPMFGVCFSHPRVLACIAPTASSSTSRGTSGRKPWRA